VSGSAGMNFSTKVPAARGMWVPAVLSYHARQSMLPPFVGPTLLAFPGAEGLWVRLLGARVCSLLGYEEGL
jgi:hypothetical protein